MLKTVQRTVAVMLGALLFCYPAYLAVSEWLTSRARFPRNAATPLSVIVGLGILYGAVLAGAVLHVRQVRRVLRAQGLRGRDVFIGGLRGSVGVFLLGFFGPFVYAWATRTEAGNLAPLMGILGFLVGLVLSAGAALVAYGLVGTATVQHKGTAS